MKQDAERIARLYEGFYSEEPFAGPIPRCVREPIPEREDRYASPLRPVTGWLILLAAAILFLWGF
jgi:hypothetical protein